MTATPAPYRPPSSRLWWLHRRSYLLFVLRELSCVFVAWFVVFLLLMVDAVHDGNDAYQEFLDWSGRPWVLLLNVVALAFVLLHAITWFNLAPKALVVRMGGRRLAPRSVAAAHFAAWALVTAVLAWIVLGVLMSKPSRTEAVTWLLFSAGGMAAALIVPVLLLLFGVVFPLGLLAPSYDHLLGLLSNPLVRIGLFLLCALALAHWAHRFRHALGDLLRVKGLNAPLAVLCYGAAVAGSVWAAIVLFQ